MLFVIHINFQSCNLSTPRFPIPLRLFSKPVMNLCPISCPSQGFINFLDSLEGLYLKSRLAPDDGKYGIITESALREDFFAPQSFGPER